MLSPAVTPRAQRTRPPSTPEPGEKENTCQRGSANRPSRLLGSAPLSPCVTNTPRSSPSPGLKQRRLRDLQKCVEDDALSAPLSPSMTNLNTPLSGLKQQRRLLDLQKGVQGEDKEHGRGTEHVCVPESPCVTNRGTPIPELKQRRLRELSKGVDDGGKEHERGTEQDCIPESPCVTKLQKGVQDDTIEDGGGTEEEFASKFSPKGRVEKCGDEGMARKDDKKLCDENESVKKSKKRRFEDVDTHANVAETRDTDQVKRLHKSAILSTPGVISTMGKVRPNPFDNRFAGCTSKSDNPRANPFDHPLPAMTTSAAPIRSYERSHQAKYLPRKSDARLDDPPVRRLVSYADLWEGVSNIDSNDTTCRISTWTYDTDGPMYDFLYDEIWKRRAETSLVSVAKRKRVYWSGNCWYGGWCRIGACVRRNGSYHDLDCPHLESLIVEAE